MTAFQASRTISIRSTHLDVGRSSYIQNPLQAASYASICQLFMVLSARLTEQQNNSLLVFLRKEVIQPHLPIRLPCYDFTPVTGSTFDSSLQMVGSLASGISDSHGVTGGVYKTRERIHRDMLIRDY